MGFPFSGDRENSSVMHENKFIDLLLVCHSGLNFRFVMVEIYIEMVKPKKITDQEINLFTKKNINLENLNYIS